MSFLDNRGETVAYLSTKHRMKTEVTLTNLISESATGKLYSIGTIIYNITPGLRKKFIKKLSLGAGNVSMLLLKIHWFSLQFMLLLFIFFYSIHAKNGNITFYSCFVNCLLDLASYET